MSVVVRWRAVLDCPLPLVEQVLYVSGRQMEGCSGLSVTSCSAGVARQWSSGGGLLWIVH